MPTRKGDTPVIKEPCIVCHEPVPRRRYNLWCTCDSIAVHPECEREAWTHQFGVCPEACVQCRSPVPYDYHIRCWSLDTTGRMVSVHRIGSVVRACLVRNWNSPTETTRSVLIGRPYIADLVRAHLGQDKAVIIESYSPIRDRVSRRSLAHTDRDNLDAHIAVYMVDSCSTSRELAYVIRGAKRHNIVLESPLSGVQHMAAVWLDSWWHIRQDVWANLGILPLTRT